MISSKWETHCGLVLIKVYLSLTDGTLGVQSWETLSYEISSIICSCEKFEQVVLISTAHLDKSPRWADESTDWVKGGMRKNIKVKYVLHKVCCKIVSEYNLWLTRLKAKWGIFIGINLLLSSRAGLL